MTQPARSYMLTCTVDPVKRELLADLRAAHLTHILTYQAEIVFGGVSGPADAPPEVICIVVRANSPAEVDAMVRADPYAQTYSGIQIKEFQQRIPEKFPGQLARVRDALVSEANERDAATAFR